MGRRLSSSLRAIALLICATYIEAFSTGALSSQCIIGWRRTSTTCVDAMFEDEDCEDLCSAFGEDSSSAAVTKLDEGTSVNLGTEGTVSNTLQRLDPRRSHARWWPEAGPSKCEPCNGSGEQTCRFCGGTHFLSGIGGETDALFYEGIGKDCPVCQDGVEVCQECSGTGHVFFMSRDINRTESWQS